MGDNRDWNGIRNSIEGTLNDILEGRDIGVNAKELSDKAGVALKNVGNYLKTNYKNAVRSMPKAAGIVKEKPQKPKVFLNAKRSESIVRIWIGIPVTVIFLIALISTSLMVPPSENFAIWLISAMPLMACTCAGCALSVPAMMRLNVLKKAKEYYYIIEGKSYINIEDIARFSHESDHTVVRNLLKMIDQRVFPEGHFDSERRCFMLSNDVYREYLALEDRRKAQGRIAQQSVPNEDSAINNKNSDLNIVIDSGRSYIYSIKELHLGITSDPMSSKLTALESLLVAIFERVKTEPKELPQMDKLMRYYLPTTLKLIKTYSDFDSIISPDNEVLETKKEIELTMDSINRAFAEFQNRLFKNSAFDASADAALLKVMLAKEGLVGGIDDKE